MPVQSVGGYVGVAPPQPQTASGGLGGLDSEAFLKLLVAQLRYQNPMSPSDPASMMQQTAQFTQVETLQQVASAQQQLLGMHQAVMAAGLIGKEISARDVDGSQITGIVDSIHFTASGPMLNIGDKSVHLTAATEIHAAGSPPTSNDLPPTTNDPDPSE